MTKLTRFPVPPPMNEEDISINLLKQILVKVDQLTASISGVQIDQATIRGEFSTKILEQSTLVDAKLLAVERRFEEKMGTRAEKVDKWFDDMQEEFSHYQTKMEGRMTSTSVKVGVIFSGATVLIGGIIAVVVRYLSLGGHPNQ
jgi:hypothetical protein